MNLFLAELIGMIWMLADFSRRLTSSVIDQLLVTCTLFVAILITGQWVSSMVGYSGELSWIGSIALMPAGLLWLLMIRKPFRPTELESTTDPSGLSLYVSSCFVLTLAPLAWFLPEPTVPTGWCQLGSVDIASSPLQAMPFVDLVVRPFSLIYGPPTACLHLLNLSAWILGGIAVYRIMALWGLRPRRSLAGCWLALSIPAIFAITLQVSPNFFTSAALQICLLFVLLWHKGNQRYAAALAGLALMLGVGSDFGLMVSAPIVAVAVILTWLFKSHFGDKVATPGIVQRVYISLLVLIVITPFTVLAWSNEGRSGDRESTIDPLAMPPPLLIEGLEPAKGPYPQWNLPCVRFALTPHIRVTVPAAIHSGPMQFLYSIGLHRRDRAKLEVRLNGQLVRKVTLTGQAQWFDGNLVLDPKGSEHILEITDVTPTSELDWREYLEHYPDVWRYLTAYNISLESGALAHYTGDGVKEGRTMQTRPVMRPAAGMPYFVIRQLELIEGDPPQ